MLNEKIDGLTTSLEPLSQQVIMHCTILALEAVQLDHHGTSIPHVGSADDMMPMPPQSFLPSVKCINGGTAREKSSLCV